MAAKQIVLMQIVWDPYFEFDKLISCNTNDEQILDLLPHSVLLKQFVVQLIMN